MIDVKQAIAAAKQHAELIFKGEDLGSPSLEEVWFDDRSHEWCVTVGLRSGPLAIATSRNFGRSAQEHLVYKTVRLDAETGDPKSVKIRDVAH
jgi:hypothetical protein